MSNDLMTSGEICRMIGFSIRKFTLARARADIHGVPAFPPPSLVKTSGTPYWDRAVVLKWFEIYKLKHKL